ncbi:MAG: hypothetical protein HOH74_19810, partial [Gemmatimonadetes bacterium]|nr:hypothetical protein [Gemmatimonadota bacterium]
HPQTLTAPPCREGDEPWVPLEDFAALVSCILKPIGDGRQSLCRDADEELCVLIDAGDTRDVEGTLFGRLAAFAEALDLQWHLCDDDMLQVGQVSGAVAALGVGDRPPQIRLPEDGTTKLVSSEHVLGKPAVYYMWASW